MQIYNSHLLNNKQRFQKAILFSFLAAIGCAIVFSLFVQFTRITFSIYYIATGYIIAKVINETGHGVGKKFAILGAGMTIFSFILTEMLIIAGFEIITMPQYWPQMARLVINSWSSFGYHNIMTLLFMFGGALTAYNNSSI